MIQVVWSLILHHEYFTSNNWGAEFVLSKESVRLLMRRGLIWRKFGENRWDLIATNGCSFEKEDRIELELKVENRLFYYVTNSKVDFNHKHLVLEKVESLGVFYKFIFLIGDIEDLSSTITTEVVFNSLYKYIEYIFILRDNNINRNLFLEEYEYPGTFEQLSTNEYMGRPAVGFRSTEKKLLKEKGMADLCLYEEFPLGGRKLVMRHLPEPRPGMYPDASPDSIRQIMYV